MEDIILSPYAPNLIESTRSIGYSLETAMADIIDNSISNFSTKIEVEFSSYKNPYIAIIDNGNGMEADELEKAMRYGSSSSLDERESQDLGRFGLGLKMASMSQCRKLTVISKKNGDISATCWDLDYIYTTKNWSLKKHSTEEIKKLLFVERLERETSGTIVLWENFDRISETELYFEKEFNEKIDKASTHLSLVFHSYLDKNKKLEIYFNNRLLDAIDPYLLSNRATQPLEEEMLFLNQVPIKIKPYVLPFTSKMSAEEKQNQNEMKNLNIGQGLYIYRNNRLIVWGKWFGLLRIGELNRLAKIRIDLPNSIDTYWTIDIKKSNAQIPSAIKEQLKQIIIRTVGKSERVYRYRGRKVSKDKLEHVWNKISERENSFQYLINKDVEIYKVLEQTLNEEQQQLLNSFVRSVEDAFPYQDVYYELAKDHQFEEKTQTDDEVYEIAKQSLDKLSDNKQGQIKLVESFKNTDLFCKYPNVIKLLEEEYYEK